MMERVQTFIFRVLYCALLVVTLTCAIFGARLGWYHAERAIFITSNGLSGHP